MNCKRLSNAIPFILLSFSFSMAWLSCTDPVNNNDEPIDRPREWHFLGLGEESITAFAVDPTDEDILFAGSSSNFSDGTVGGIFRSIDGGAAWDTLIRGVTVRDIDIHPSDHQIVYVTCGMNYLTPQGLLRTTDGGESWEAVSGIVLNPDEGLSVCAIDPSSPDTMYVGSSGLFGGHLLRSIDGSQTWSVVSTSFMDLNGITALLIDPENPNNVYVGTSEIGLILHSDDYGENWEQLDFPAVGLVNQLAYIQGADRLLCACTWYFGFYYSSDDGLTWSRENQGLPNPISVSSICSDGDSLYIAAGGYGAFSSNMTDTLHWHAFGDSLFSKASIVYSEKNHSVFVGTAGVYSFR